MEELHVTHLKFQYPTQISARQTNKNSAVVLDDVSFRIERGEFVLLCGESGSGKTTLLRMLKPEIAPVGKREGEIVYFGDTTELALRTSASKIAYVGQDPDASVVTDKVYHELAFGLENLGADNGLMRRRIGELAHYFGIEKWFRADTSTLSGGQKQILSLAAALVTDPQILLLDEPTSQLDPITAADFLSVLRRLNSETGITVIICEHRLEEIFPICDRVLTLEQGSLVTDCPPRAAAKILRGHLMEPALPAASRIYHLLELYKEDAPIPLSVKEGRDLVERRIASAFSGPLYSVGEGDKGKEKIALSLKDVWFRYSKSSNDVLRGIDLNIKEGSCTCLLGGNGTGKSTLLSCMAGLDKVYRGKIRTYRDGKETNLRRAYLPQDAADVFARESVVQDLCDTLARVHPELSAEAVSERVTGLAQRFGVAELIESHPYDLSGGELVRCAIVRSLLCDPELLLLDEPTRGLDPLCKNILRDMFHELCENGVTVIFVSHDVEFAALCADECAMIFDGESTPLATPRKFFSQNIFYTTAANRILRRMSCEAILCEDVKKLCHTT